MSSTIWLQNNKILRNSSNKILLCDECPCIQFEGFTGDPNLTACSETLGALVPIYLWLNLGNIIDSTTLAVLATGASIFGRTSIRLQPVTNTTSPPTSPWAQQVYLRGYSSFFDGLPSDTVNDVKGIGQVLAVMDCSIITVLNSCNPATFLFDGNINRFKRNSIGVASYGNAYNDWLGGASNAFVIDWSDNFYLESLGPFGTAFQEACSFPFNVPSKMQVSLSYLPSNPP